MNDATEHWKERALVAEALLQELSTEMETLRAKFEDAQAKLQDKQPLSGGAYYPTSDGRYLVADYDSTDDVTPRRLKEMTSRDVERLIGECVDPAKAALVVSLKEGPDAHSLTVLLRTAINDVGYYRITRDEYERAMFDADRFSHLAEDAARSLLKSARLPTIFLISVKHMVGRAIHEAMYKEGYRK